MSLLILTMRRLEQLTETEDEEVTLTDLKDALSNKCDDENVAPPTNHSCVSNNAWNLCFHGWRKKQNKTKQKN